MLMGNACICLLQPHHPCRLQAAQGTHRLDQQPVGTIGRADAARGESANP
jgi:hypothetical protein